MWAEPAQKGLDKLHKYMEQGGEPYYILVELENLRDFYEVTRKDAKDFIDWYQKEIVKDILTMIAATFDYDIKPYVLMLRRLGADWRELDVIEDSINRGHLRENQQYDRTAFIARHEDEVLAAFKKGLMDGLNRLWSLNIKANEIDRVEEIVEEYKDTYMRLILTYIKEGDMFDYGTAKSIIIKLWHAGIEWPELKVPFNSIMQAFKEQDDLDNQD